MRRILICRTDRIGDLVLTLPLVRAIREAFPDARVGMLVNPTTAPLVVHHPDVDDIFIDDEHGEHEGLPGFGALSLTLRRSRYDTALLPRCTWRLASLMVSADVRRRVGNGLRAYLPLINRPIFIHRSHPPIHETTYCLAFLQPLGVEEPPPENPRIHLTPLEREGGREILQRHGIDDPTRVIGLHPGAGGSGSNMAPDRWFNTARVVLDATGADRVVVTGTATELPLAERIAAPLRDRAVVVAGETTLRDLCAVQSHLKLVLGPSTGPLHTAAAVGTPVLAFYGARLSQCPEKWRPLGARVGIVRPDGPLCEKCRGYECDRHHCLDNIRDDQILAVLRDMGLVWSR